ncbi:DrmB family protein [Clostridium butyricum]
MNKKVGKTMSDLQNKYQISMKRMKVRASTLVFPFGTGAMIDLPDWVLMTTSGEYWDKKKLTTIHDERLEKVLGVNGFKSPVVKHSDDDIDENKKDDKLYMPFVQFPTWYFCPKCRRFKTLKEWERDYKKVNGEESVMKRPVCSEPKCKVKLAPARLVVACENGHIDDFPWIQWTHLKDHKKICANPQLFIKTSGVTSGLEGITVECKNKNCGARISLSGTFTSSDKNEFEMLEKKAQKDGLVDEKFSLKCKGNRPWDGTKDDECGLYPTTVQRGAINVYFPELESSIIIPPYSDKFTKQIEESSEFEKMNIQLETIENLKISNELKKNSIDETIKEQIEAIAKETTLDKLVVEKIILRKQEKIEDERDAAIDKIKYKEEEYKALTGEISYDIINQADFKIEAKEVKEYCKKYLKRVVLIHKMREVRVLTGFSRINGPDNNIMDSDDEEELGNKKYKLIKPLSDRNWYPAVEVNGEGIFIELDENIIERWINENPEVTERINNIDKKYYKILSDKGFSIRRITPKFILLHTLSHLIIKELSFKCGYSSTSLRERIYCNKDDNSYHMCGVMIYTANGDSEGTLGGLVRQGKSDRLPRIIDSAIEKARFCSLDPVCIESLGQGRDGLNLAACFSCCLVSETSCEEFNTLLDRALIVGTLDNEKIGFFNNYK